MKNYIHDGDVIEFTNNTGATLLSGAVISLNGVMGIVISDTLATRVGYARVRGVAAVPKVVATVINAFDKLDWDVSTARFDKLGALASGDVGKCVTAVAAAGNGAATVNVLLNVVGGSVTP
jgi:predicted RecA/RadA family phage recombinase